MTSDVSEAVLTRPGQRQTRRRRRARGDAAETQVKRPKTETEAECSRHLGEAIRNPCRICMYYEHSYTK